MVGVLVTLLVVVLWYRVAYSPAKSSAAKAKDQTEQTKNRTDTLKRQIQGDAAKKKEKAEAIPSSKLVAAVPVDDQITTFLRRSDAIALSSGVNYQSVTPSLGGPSGGVSVINVGMTVDGSYASVMTYLRTMMNDKRILLIDNVSVTAGGSENAANSGGGPAGPVFAGAGAAPNLQITISGRLFAQPDTTALATSPAGAGASQTVSPAGGPAPGSVQNS
jgi:Tfp pilus assembly protein PilO